MYIRAIKLNDNIEISNTTGSINISVISLSHDKKDKTTTIIYSGGSNKEFKRITFNSDECTDQLCEDGVSFIIRNKSRIPRRFKLEIIVNDDHIVRVLN